MHQMGLQQHLVHLLTHLHPCVVLLIRLDTRSRQSLYFLEREANGAQVIIDQFVAGAEQKWHRMNGLVMLLPHGYEGQGPEHSSGRIERFLQMCAELNMVVTNITTASNYFHVLRRQLAWPFRKPLINFAPKANLRHPGSYSKMEEFTQGGFKEI